MGRVNDGRTIFCMVDDSKQDQLQIGEIHTPVVTFLSKPSAAPFVYIATSKPANFYISYNLIEADKLPRGLQTYQWLLLSTWLLIYGWILLFSPGVG